MGMRYHPGRYNQPAYYDPLPPPPPLAQLEPPYPHTVANFTLAWTSVPLHPYNQNALDILRRSFIAEERHAYARRLPQNDVVRVIVRWFNTLRLRWVEENLVHIPLEVSRLRKDDKAGYNRRYRV